MKYIIPENKIDKIVFKYLDNTLKGLEKKKSKNYEGFIFGFPDQEHGILGWEEEDNVLYIYYELLNEISTIFGLKNSDSKKLVGRWFSDKFQLEVKYPEREFTYREFTYI